MAREDGKDTGSPSDLKKIVAQAAVRMVLAVALAGALLFAAAGRLDWPMAWAYLAFALLSTGAGLIHLARNDPELLHERLKGFKGAEPWDKVLAPLVAFVVPMTLLAVAALDKRFGWSPEVPLTIQLLAFAALVGGYGFTYWALAANTFFAAGVRIQSERGHKVVSHGPYALVRHPGYTGAIVAFLGLAVALGSLWALIPALINLILLAVRTALEDRLLMKELDGYPAYAARVCHKLLPGVW